MSDFPTSSLSDERRAGFRYLRAIRQHWVLVVGTVVMSLTAAVLIVATAEKRYKAVADVLITPLSLNDDTFQGFSVFRQGLDGSSTVVTAARVLRSPAIRDSARRALGDDARSTTITIEPLSQSDIVAITATAPTAERAARGANTYAQTAVSVRTAIFKSELNRQISWLKRNIAAIPPEQRSGNFQYGALVQRLSTLTSYTNIDDPTLQIVAQATPPTSPSWPRPTLTYVVALLASLLAGCGIAVLLEVFNPRVTREDELQLDQRLPILTRIPRLRSSVVKGYLVGRNQLPASAWRAYRTLRAVLATAGADGGFPRSILVTSPSQADGKTMTATNLAITLAAAGMRVVLVDGDLHRPMMAVVFHLAPKGRGLVGVLSGRETVTNALIESPAHPRLSLLLAHHGHTVQTHLTGEQQIRALLDELRPLADVVVIDSPPLPEVADALDMAAAADAVILCVRLGNTRRDKLNQLREMLARRGASPVGFAVTTRVPLDRSYDAYEHSHKEHFPAPARTPTHTEQQPARLARARSVIARSRTQTVRARNA